jgi:hypothetical protein
MIYSNCARVLPCILPYPVLYQHFPFLLLISDRDSYASQIILDVVIHPVAIGM